jgi:hypothetical protein
MGSPLKFFAIEVDDQRWETARLWAAVGVSHTFTAKK